jgi:hypothetical protein
MCGIIGRPPHDPAVFAGLNRTDRSISGRRSGHMSIFQFVTHPFGRASVMLEESFCQILKLSTLRVN